MKLLADESIDRQIVDRLRQDGHQIWYVAEMEPGIPDDAVLDLANRETALLLTAKILANWCSDDIVSHLASCSSG